jgi:DNA-binding response OmpR family regulator
MLDNLTGLFYIDNIIINLSTMETELFECLIHHKYRLVTYKVLLKEVYNENEDNYTNRNKIVLLMQRLRNKIKDYVTIRNMRGRGYILELR